MIDESIKIFFYIKLNCRSTVEKKPPLRSTTMVSRRRILSRSRDDLNLPEAPIEEEDIWYSKDKLLKVREKYFFFAVYPFHAFLQLIFIIAYYDMASISWHSAFTYFGWCICYGNIVFLVSLYFVDLLYNICFCAHALFM